MATSQEAEQQQCAKCGGAAVITREQMSGWQGPTRNDAVAISCENRCTYSALELAKAYYA